MNGKRNRIKRTKSHTLPANWLPNGCYLCGTAQPYVERGRRFFDLCAEHIKLSHDEITRLTRERIQGGCA